MLGIKKIISSVLLCCFCFSAMAQNKYWLNYQMDKQEQTVFDNLSLTTQFPNVFACKEYVSKLPSLLQSKGFVTNSIDSVRFDSLSATIQLYLGKKYVWANVLVHPVDEELLEDLGYQQKQYTQQPLNFAQLAKLQERLINFFETNGYPFAAVHFDSVQIKDEQVSGVLQIERGGIYKIDSIQLFGNLRISKGFLHRYLNIPAGSPYNKTLLEKINQRMNELPYLQQSSPWTLNMLNTGAVINLYLQTKKASQVNALVGFLPNNSQTINNKILITGEANLNLKNALGLGETIGLNWQQLQPSSPRLNVLYQHPFIFNSAFGIDFNFNLYRKDSLFLNIDASLGLQYVFNSNQTGKIIFSQQSTSLQSEGIDTLNIKLSKRLPETIDVSSWNVGVDYAYNNTNYRFNPRRGWDLQLQCLVGQKTISRNNSISSIKALPGDNFNYNSLYDSIANNAYQIRLKLNAAKYFTTGKNTVLKLAVNGGWFQSPNYFRNELFQIGGYKLLRGFDEESVFANQYAVATAEFRFLFGLNSYFSVFTDQGFSNYKTAEINRSYNYQSYGIGLSFETAAGIFNIAYAAGKRSDLSFDLRQSKIHIGFVTLF